MWYYYYDIGSSSSSSIIILFFFISIFHHNYILTPFLDCLERKTALSGTALKWMDSYLDGRTQRVIDAAISESADLKYGVAQGCVLGPILFTIDTIPIGIIARCFNLKIQLFTDNTQLYVFFKIKAATSQWVVMRALESCVVHIRIRMAATELCLNDSKTELVIGTPWYQHCIEVNGLTLWSTQVTGVPVVSNLGVVMDQALSRRRISISCVKPATVLCIISLLFEIV